MPCPAFRLLAVHETLFRTASDKKLGGAWEQGYHYDYQFIWLC